METLAEGKIDMRKSGIDMWQLMKLLYPICRSITGDGVRQTLKMISEYIKLDVHEVKSGTKVFDWVVPREWNISDAYIKDKNGEKVVDFKKCNLHVVSYSTPVKAQLSLDELKKHLHTSPEHPHAIPYVTSYYEENWGFCMAHSQHEKLQEGMYDVFIGSTLENGSLTYGEYIIKGETQDEVLLTCYTCHPSMCNDNLSGVVVTAKLAWLLTNKNNKKKLRYTYRFLFMPETIGAITWLSRNKDSVQNIKHGIVACCIGDKGHLTYKRTRRNTAEIDRIAEKILKDIGIKHDCIDFFPNGSDERQFCSPGFNLPVGSLLRTPYGKYPEYHSSEDDLSCVSAKALEESVEAYLKIIEGIEKNRAYVNLNPHCEPNLGRRGLYPKIGGQKKQSQFLNAIKWVLNLSDGTNDLIEIANRSGMAFAEIAEAIEPLMNAGLLKEKKE